MEPTPNRSPAPPRRFAAAIPGALMMICLACTDVALAWGPKGHAAVGALAAQQAGDAARNGLRAILGTLEPDRLDAACNWPDHIRDDPEWDWAAPLHYVNLPRAADRYDRQRDCDDGLCVSEGIRKYAGELMNAQLPRERRELAFNWLCHLVADLHQPLHAGFADDRGGNTVEVTFEGEQANLHWYWDSLVIPRRLETAAALMNEIPRRRCDATPRRWSPAEVDDWTAESHRLAIDAAYPLAAAIDRDFAQASWRIARERLGLAARRLARILDATLGDGEVVVAGEP